MAVGSWVGRMINKQIFYGSIYFGNNNCGSLCRSLLSMLHSVLKCSSQLSLTVTLCLPVHKFSVRNQGSITLNLVCQTLNVFFQYIKPFIEVTVCFWCTHTLANKMDSYLNHWIGSRLNFLSFNKWCCFWKWGTVRDEMRGSAVGRGN